MVDTGQFQAITDQLAEHEQRIAAFCDILAAIGDRAGIDVPDVMRPRLRPVHGPGRHSKPRGRLRGIDGGAA